MAPKAAFGDHKQRRFELEALQQEARSLQRSINDSLKKEAKRRKEACSHIAKSRGFGHRAKVFFILVAQLSGSFGAAMEWLELETRRGRWGDPSRRSPQTKPELEHDMWQMHDAYLHSHAVQTSLANIDDERHFRVQMYLAEWKTFQWVVHFNWKGVAPSTRDVLDTVLGNFSADSRGLRHDAFVRWILASPKSLERWAHAFRSRWRLQWNSMATKPPITPADIREKVAMTSPSHNIGPKSEASFGLPQ